jgi:restriction system protein
MKSYYRIMLGKQSAHAAECFAGGYIGAGFDINQDLTGKLPENWREFNKAFIPVYLQGHPEKSRVGAGLACGALWTVCKGIRTGDTVLCPDGEGGYRIGEVTGGYQYRPGTNLPHRRSVRWGGTIQREGMSDALRNSTGSIGTVSTITHHAEEVERLIAGTAPPRISVNDETIEDVGEFAMERHLEDFLVQNWRNTDLGRRYDIYEEDGELVGQQYETDTGRIDVLAISKDRREILVVELKKGRVSDTVVGQIQRYMGYVKEELAEEGQAVKGVIIALEDDIRLRRALSVAPNIEFYRYKVRFELFKG